MSWVLSAWSARNVEHTPPRSAEMVVTHRRHRQLHLVGLLLGLDEIEYWRGVSDLSTSTHSSGDASTGYSARTSTGWRPHAQSVSFCLFPSVRRARAGRRTRCGRQRTGRNRLISWRTRTLARRARRNVMSSPHTLTGSSPVRPVTSSHSSISAWSLSGHTPRRRLWCREDVDGGERRSCARPLPIRPR